MSRQRNLRALGACAILASAIVIAPVHLARAAEAPSGRANAGLVQLLISDVPPQLAERVKAAILASLTAAGLTARDATNAAPALAYVLRPAARKAILTTLSLDVAVLASLSREPEEGGKVAYLYVVEARDGRTGAWLMAATPTCPDCADSELLESITVSTEAMIRAANRERTGDYEPEPPRDRADHGARLLKLATAASDKDLAEAAKNARLAYRAGAQAPAAILAAETFTRMQEFESARHYLEIALAAKPAPEIKARAQRVQAYLDWAFGNWSSAVTELEPLTPAPGSWTAGMLDFARERSKNDADLVTVVDRLSPEQSSPVVNYEKVGDIAIRAGLGARAYLAMGGRALRERDYPHALAYFDKFLSLEPTNGLAKQGRERALKGLPTPNDKRVFRGTK